MTLDNMQRSVQMGDTLLAGHHMIEQLLGEVVQRSQLNFSSLYGG